MSETWVEPLGKGKSLEVGWGGYRVEEEWPSYLETIWGRTIAVICRAEWEGPHCPLSSTFICTPLLFKSTPIPLSFFFFGGGWRIFPWHLVHGGGGACRGGGFWGSPGGVRAMLTLHLAPPAGSHLGHGHDVAVYKIRESLEEKTESSVLPFTNPPQCPRFLIS